MPYDPSFPATDAFLISSEFRSQFTGIVDLIQTIPVGPAGPAGVTAAVIDGVTTEAPGSSAAASVTLTGSTLHFSLNIPRGDVGATGLTGSTGADGGTGATGAMGPPFTSFVIDSVTTVAPGQPATAAAVFDGVNVRLSFGLPAGLPGAQGVQGVPGDPGATGAVGPAFTNFVIDAANTLPAGTAASVSLSFDGVTARFTFGIPQGLQGEQGIPGVPGPSDLSGTSNNTNSVALLGMAVSDPPTQAQMQAIANKLDEFITAGRR